MELISKTGTIKLPYIAKQVNIVTKNNAQLEIFLDDKPLTEQNSGKDVLSKNILTVTNPDLYNIINSGDDSSHTMELKIQGKGFQIFTFTFG
jgi:hypothetical protein